MKSYSFISHFDNCLCEPKQGGVLLFPDLLISFIYLLPEGKNRSCTKAEANEQAVKLTEGI